MAKIEHTIRRKKVIDLETGKEMDDISPLTMIIDIPEVPLNQKLTKEDVWGKYDESYHRISKGMIVASRGEKCPYFHDIVEYKSVTVKCNSSEENEVIYWLEYVYGTECVEEIKNLPGRKIAIRANYMCW